MASSNDDVHAVCLQVLPNLDSDIFEYIVGLLEDYDAPSSNYDDDDDVLQSTIAEFLVEAEYCHDEAKAKDTASELLLRIRALKSQDPSAPTTAATATTATKSTPGIGVLPIQSDGCVAQATRKAAALSIKAVPPSPQPQTETRSSLTPDASSNTKNNDTDNAVVAVATMPISSSSSNNGSTSTTSSISKVESARESRKTAGKKKDRTNNNKAADRRIVQEALEMEAALYDARVAAIHARTVQGTYKGTLDLSPSFTLPNPGGGIPLLEDATGTLVSGRIYGLIGRNGTGKSTLLRALASRSVGNIPPNVVVHYVSQEVNLTQEQRVQKRPVDCVLEADLERTLLLQELSSLEQDAEAGRLDGPGSARHALVLSRLDEIGSDSAERRATELLSNLGFTSELQSRNLEQLSGGWRVRTMLAAAIFSKPDVLLLDEPTNHLSIRAVLWLTRELATNETWKSRIVMIVSHDRHFMDEVCTDCLHISGAAKRLTQSRGNYSQWAFQRREQQALFAKTQTGRQEEIDKLREYAGHGFKYGGSASQINKMGMKSKQADKLEEEQTQQAQELAALVEDLELPMTIGSGGELDGFVVQLRNVGFGYPNSSPSLLFKHCEIGITSKSRIVLLGENGMYGI